MTFCLEIPVTTETGELGKVKQKARFVDPLLHPTEYTSPYLIVHSHYMVHNPFFLISKFIVREWRLNPEERCQDIDIM